MKKIDPLNYLKRKDKWYLGGGNRLVWAPQFPLWLDVPGFWDKAHYYNYEIEPVFTWVLLDDNGVEIPLRCSRRLWNPATLRTQFTPSGSVRGLDVTEEKSCLPNDVLLSSIAIANRSSKSRRVHLVGWTAQPSHPSKRLAWLTGLECRKGRIYFARHLESPARPHFQFECAFGMSRKPDSYAILPAEGSSMHPRWAGTPFVDDFRGGKLSNTFEEDVVGGDGVLFIALHAAVDVKANGKEEISLFFGAGPTRIDASAAVHHTVKQEKLPAMSGRSWQEFFSMVPAFACSDEFLTRYYWYRWYGLRLNMIRGGEGNYRHPAVCEGIGYFRAPISYSAACHALETRWMHDPELARGCLLNFIESQRDDGSFPGYLDVNYYRNEFFYHANWGNALVQVDAVHPSDDFLERVYEGLKKYAMFLDRERDRESSGLCDVINHYETGQEYTHRYMAVDSDADRENWGDVFRLKGVDATVYAYELKQCLGRVAGRLHRAEEEVDEWQRGAGKIRTSILGQMWDPEAEMFFDVNPMTGLRTMVKSATCFYPYMTDIVSELHSAGLQRHLFNPREFWTAYPVPSLSVDDEYFSANADWKGRRMNCPWNGRVWPMTNSHIAEVLARNAIRLNDESLRKQAADFMSKFIRMMFLDGLPDLPNSFEHYHPFSGAPSIYRGVDDYQHSWIVDLIIKYVAGIRPGQGEVIVDPFPFALEWFDIRQVFVAGREMRVARQGNVYNVWVDGKFAASGTVGRETRIVF